MSFKLFSSKFRSKFEYRENLSLRSNNGATRIQNPPCIPLNTNFNEKALSSPLLTCRPARRRTPVNDRIRPFQQYLGRGKRGSPAFLASPFLSPLSLSPPRTRLHRVSPVARASRNFNEASCGSQIREIVSRPARRIARHHFSTTHRCLRP